MVITGLFSNGLFEKRPESWNTRLEMVIECKTTSSIVMTDLFSNGSFEKRPES